MPKAIDEITLRTLRETLRGQVLTSGDSGYDEARRIWNGRFDPRPAAIARCVDAADVVSVLDIARSQAQLVCVRSGGHDYAGNSSHDGALVIDLSSMNGIDVDPASRTLRVGPGARWGAIDRAAQKFGLATTGGTVSTVAVAGYTLGGGTGHLVRKFGLGLDNLRSLDVVTASGERLMASDAENPDLFWGLRGGSGNLGIATSFEFRLHDLRTELLAGQIIHPLADAFDVLRFYRSFMGEASDDVQCYAFFIRIPPIPAFPADLHHKIVLDLVVSHAGAAAAAESALRPLRSFGRSSIDTVARVPYVALQQAFDAGMGAGNRWFSRAHYLPGLTDAAIESILARVESLPGELTMVYLEPEGGAISRVAPEATAFPHRRAAFALHVLSGWTRASDDDAIMDWTRLFHDEMAPHATGGVYVNMLGGGEPDGVRSAYGSNLGRLADLKAKFDPGNLLHMNQNVAPRQ